MSLPPRRPDDGDPDAGAPPPASTPARPGWFVLLRFGGVAAVTVVGHAIRTAILP